MVALLPGRFGGGPRSCRCHVLPSQKERAEVDDNDNGLARNPTPSIFLSNDCSVRSNVPDDPPPRQTQAGDGYREYHGRGRFRHGRHRWLDRETRCYWQSSGDGSLIAVWCHGQHAGAPAVSDQQITYVVERQSLHLGRHGRESTTLSQTA